jgi:hypothetical protein
MALAVIATELYRLGLLVVVASIVFSALLAPFISVLVPVERGGDAGRSLIENMMTVLRGLIRSESLAVGGVSLIASIAVGTFIGRFSGGLRIAWQSTLVASSAVGLTNLSYYATRILSLYNPQVATALYQLSIVIIPFLMTYYLINQVLGVQE